MPGLVYLLNLPSTSFEPDVVILCVCHTTPTEKQFCLHVFRYTLYSNVVQSARLVLLA